MPPPPLCERAAKHAIVAPIQIFEVTYTTLRQSSLSSGIMIMTALRVMASSTRVMA